MRIWNIEKRDVHRGPLILVNAAHPLREGAVGRMVALEIAGEGVQLDSRAAALLGELLTELRAGDRIVPVSGYRSRAEQVQIYEESLRDNGEAFTRQYVALPDCSEHQTGLAIDLGERRESIDFIRPDFPEDGICGAFRRRAARYGFILRYAEDKQSVTGIAHEPWHFRYVGAPHAEIMEREGLCLEEYVDYLRAFPYGERALRLEERGVEIGFVPGPARIALPDDAMAQVSGDNVDGCVVTLWRNRR